jgi:hypothetical protein
MKAEQPNTTVADSTSPTTTPSAETIPPVSIGQFSDYIPSYRVIGLILLVVLLIGVWWYASKQSREAASKTWSEFTRAGQSTSDLEMLSQGGSYHARLELARLLYGPQGLAQLSQSDKDLRNKGIASIQKARDEFRELADRFKGDTTLRVSCLLSSAEAELTLVGIPKDGSSSESLGSVTKAAELHKTAADIVGVKTPLGEQYLKRAEELLAKQKEIQELGVAIINKLAPAPVFNLGPNNAGPKPPEGPITPQGIPEIKKDEGPKAPSIPVPVSPTTAPVTPSTTPSPATSAVSPPKATPATAPSPATAPASSPTSKK